MLLLLATLRRCLRRRRQRKQLRSQTFKRSSSHSSHYLCRALPVHPRREPTAHRQQLPPRGLRLLGRLASSPASQPGSWPTTRARQLQQRPQLEAAPVATKNARAAKRLESPPPPHLTNFRPDACISSFSTLSLVIWLCTSLAHSCSFASILALLFRHVMRLMGARIQGCDGARGRYKTGAVVTRESE